MNLVAVSPGKFKRLAYRTSAKYEGVRIRVESSIPINVFIVQFSELEAWLAQERIHGAMFTSVTRVRSDFTFPDDFDRDWYLILDNRQSDRPAAVRYELFDI